MSLSEFNTIPKKILIHNPSITKAIERIDATSLEKHNFLAVPDAQKLYEQYNQLISKINSLGIETIELMSLLDDPGQIADNPNLIFTRDSSITLPWSPDVFIPARLMLEGRRHESELVSGALKKLGLQPIISFDHDEYIEGGDVLPVTFQGLRTLVIGFGSRTTQAAALKIARELIPEHLDMVMGLRHDPDVLHLDTGFTLLPQQTILAAKDMFNDGFLITQDQRIQSVDPIQYAQDLGFTVHRTTKEDATMNERCNMLPLGNNTYISFQMPETLKNNLEITAGITIHTIDGNEIAKGTGGVHCLTRPIY